MSIKFALVLSMFIVALGGAISPVHAQKKYDPGATDTEIKIGNIMPYSGPASAYSAIGKAEAAYFQKINDEGGINGRKIKFLSVDDGYSPPKTVEMARKLVEQDEVLLIFQVLGTPPSSAIQKYMNAKKVPELFVASGASKWDNPQNFPWTMGWAPKTKSKVLFTAGTLCRPSPTPRSACCSRMTTTAKTISKGSRTDWAIRRRK